MIRVPFDPRRLAGEDRRRWDEWEVRARRAADALAERVRRGEQPADAFDKKIWSELKQWLFDNVFHGKCAYCEGKVTPQSWGDAEHWRPKGAVTVRDGDGDSVVGIERDGTPHPGYWWLAYEWTNLLPACQRCNAGDGKNTQFPVAGTRVFDPREIGRPDELDAVEQPLLLHPFRDPDPAEHLSFDDLGVVSATDGSERGRMTIEVFDLNRAALVDDRFGLVAKAQDAFLAAFLNTSLGHCAWPDAIASWTDPDQPYALAMRQLFERLLMTKLAQFPSADDAGVAS